MHGPATKTRVAYILSLLRETEKANESSVIEEEEENSDEEEGDITMFDCEVSPHLHNPPRRTAVLFTAGSCTVYMVKIQ